MNRLVAMMVFLVFGYLGWDAYTFFYDSSSELLTQEAQVAQLQTEVDAKMKKVQDAKKFFASLESKRAEIRKLSSRLADMKSTLSESLDIPNFMKVVLTEAKRIGISITSLTPQPISKAKDPNADFYIEQPFDVTFQGVYVQLIAFLDRLSQASKIIRVDDFSIRPQTTATVGGTDKNKTKFVPLTGSIVVKTYAYKGSKEDDLARQGGVAAAGASPPAGGGVKW